VIFQWYWLVVRLILETNRIDQIQPTPTRSVRLLWVTQYVHGSNPYWPVYVMGQDELTHSVQTGRIRLVLWRIMGRIGPSPDSPLLVFFLVQNYFNMWEGIINFGPLYCFFIVLTLKLMGNSKFSKEKINNKIWHGSNPPRRIWVVNQVKRLNSSSNSLIRLIGFVTTHVELVS